jgi:uncharacterized protein (TIGR03437 family)
VCHSLYEEIEENMHRALGLIIATACPLFAQFSQLTAIDDGTQVYFTSTLLLKGTTSTATWPEARLYLNGPGGVTLYAQRGALAPQIDNVSSQGVSSPQVSGDGSLIGFTFNNICPAGPTCTTPVPSEAELRGAQTLDLGPGSLQLSRNGKWALVTSVQTIDPQTHQLAAQTSTLINLATGARNALPGPPAGANRTLASDGTVLVLEPAGSSGGAAGVGLWKLGQFTPLQLAGGFQATALSDDASTLIYQVVAISPGATPSASLLSLDLASGRQTVLFQTNVVAQGPVFLAASNDGQTVLYLVRSAANPNVGTAYIASASTGRIAPVVLPAGESVAAGALTGAGDLAFVSTTAGRIVKFAVAPGVVSELVPATPFCQNLNYLAPGSRITLQCNVAGSVDDLTGQVLVDNQGMPVLAASQGQITVQVPWGDQHPSSSFLAIDTPSSSPFQSRQSVNFAYFPTIFQGPAGQTALFGLLFVKGDWSGLLTGPPGPGDIIYTYMTGLGPVNGPMLTGAPASLSIPSPIVGTFTCQFLPEAEPAKTLFAGLAPGMVGIYQVAFQMPANAGPPWTGITCNFDIPGLAVGGFSLGGGLSSAPTQSPGAAVQ